MNKYYRFIFVVQKLQDNFMNTPSTLKLDMQIGSVLFSYAFFVKVYKDLLLLKYSNFILSVNVRIITYTFV